MTLNYRKRVQIAPGVHLNISKKGVSTTVGIRGASVSFGKNGTYVNTGIPGTGFYSRQRIDGQSVTPMNKISTGWNTPKQYTRGQYVMGFIACIIAAIATFIVGIESGGFFWWMAFLFFVIASIGQYSNMVRSNSSSVDNISDSKYIQAAKEELCKNHNEEEKRILQNFIDCYTIIDEIDEEEGIIESLKEANKYPELLSIHENKLADAKERLLDIQYDVDPQIRNHPQKMK